MGTQGIGVFGINSKFASGSLVFYEKAVGRTATGDVFTVGTAAVKVGNTANDIDFQYYGTGSLSAIIDCALATLTIVGITATTNKPLTITDATATSSTTTGALIVTGGIATAADITCGDDLFISSAGVINFGASNALITHSTGLLTFSAGNVAFGVDGTGIDVTFFGDGASYKAWFDQNGDTNGAFFFGADDYGIDVGFYGQTASNSMVWDASANALVFTAAGITLGVTNIALDTVTGTKLGTGTTQKLGFWNAAPVTQQAHIADPAADLGQCVTAITAINALCATLGLTAAS